MAGTSRPPVAALGAATYKMPLPGAPAAQTPIVAHRASVPVSCQSDLALDQSPNAPYNFLCTQDGRPLTWRQGQSINLYTSGLTQLQSSVLPEALSQWEAEGGFTVVQVSSAESANVTLDDARLDDSEAGSTTVRYQCTEAACFYTYGTMHLSSSAPLTRTLWGSTILHELGHLAGLNHVSRTEEVLYPVITDTSPDAYTPGDIQGLQALALARQGSSAAVGTVVTGTAAVGGGKVAGRASAGTVTESVRAPGGSSRSSPGAPVHSPAACGLAPAALAARRPIRTASHAHGR